ncbi:MAG TPA: hypothetical protein VNO17_11850, partial [Actinomycetota bacterium]|nr:hypothetical protein [Actinomycetota bacterium]
MRGRPLIGWLVAAALVAGSVGSLAGPSALAQRGGGRETPPPTPVPPFGSPSPFPTRLRTPEPSTEPPALSAAAAVLVDLETGQVLHGVRADERRPVASLTKIMTALLVLERA